MRMRYKVEDTNVFVTLLLFFKDSRGDVFFIEKYP